MSLYTEPGFASGTPALRAVDLCLRITVAAQCVGVARWMYLGQSPLAALPVLEAAAAAVLLGVAPLVLLQPRRGVLLLVVACQVGVVLATLLAKGLPAGLLAPASQAVRYAGPLGLALLVPRRAEAPPGPERVGVVVWIFRLAAAATFVGHGIEALQVNPRFIDLIESAGARLLRYDVPDAAIPPLLRLIGGLDLLAAAALLSRRWRWVAAYMALWGWLTASSRLLHFGVADGAHETLMRFANGGLAFSILLFWHLGRPAPDPEAVPEAAVAGGVSVPA